MRAIKLIIIFLVHWLIERSCLCEASIEITEPGQLTELEDAAVKIVTTCYSNRGQTIALLTDVPGTFIRRLSTQLNFSFVMLDDRRRVESFQPIPRTADMDRFYKVHIIIIILSHYYRYTDDLQRKFHLSHFDPMASVLVLNWSPIYRNGGCPAKSVMWQTLYFLNLIQFPNANVMCRDHTQGLVMHTLNPYTNRTHEPWRFEGHNRHMGNYFMRPYREDEGMCHNLHFDKTHDLGGSDIEVALWTTQYEGINYWNFSKTRIMSENAIRSTHDAREYLETQYIVVMFMAYINATQKNMWSSPSAKEYSFPRGIKFHNTHLRGCQTRYLSFAYPHRLDCKVLLSQHRGNKSQLEKILAVIDSYSWIGMGMVYFITFMFFKYFLRQPLSAGLMNLMRLTCNFGFPRLPSNVAPRIYLSCLLFFGLTMHGIFEGSLASLLTHDFPVRQINSIKDLADLGYTVHIDEVDLKYFDDPRFGDHVVINNVLEDRLQPVIDDPSAASVMWGGITKDYALQHDLYIGTDCIIQEYTSFTTDWKWAHLGRFDKFLLSMIAADLMLPWHVAVSERRLRDKSKIEEIAEPKVMTLVNLGFAFAILGVGLGLASIVFIAERLIYRYNRGVTSTRVVRFT